MPTPWRFLGIVVGLAAATSPGPHTFSAALRTSNTAVLAPARNQPGCRYQGARWEAAGTVRKPLCIALWRAVPLVPDNQH